MAGPEHGDTATGAVIGRWAQTFRLIEVPQPGELAGKTEYTGQIEGLPVQVWAVTAA